MQLVDTPLKARKKAFAEMNLIACALPLATFEDIYRYLVADYRAKWATKSSHRILPLPNQTSH